MTDPNDRICATLPLLFIIRCVSVDPLRQRLKELDPHGFESLCFDILKERHPGCELIHVEGSSGDEGLDVFEGELCGRPTVWQAKSFPNGIGKSQKEQIRKSLRTALKHFTPAHWILCLSVDMEAKTIRWFEKWKKSHSSVVKVGLFSASDIMYELLHRRSIRNHYFPEAALDPVELKRIVAKTGELSLEQMESIADNHLEDFVERLKERDARFNYQIIFDGDLGPPKTRDTLPQGLVLSISTGAKTLNVFARDVDALRSNPPRVKFSLSEEGLAKLQALTKTGAQQEFVGDELRIIESDFALLSPLIQGPRSPRDKLIIGPSPALTNKKRPVRLTFRNDTGASLEYPLLDVKPVRVGTDEAEFSCTGENLPFELAIVVPSGLLHRDSNVSDGEGGKLTFTYELIGSQVKQVKRFLDAIALLDPGGEIELFDLKLERILFATRLSLASDSDAVARRNFFTDLARVGEVFKLELQIPSNVTNEDIDSLLLLKTFAENGTRKLEDISADIAKTEENKDLPKQLTNRRGVFRFIHPRQEPMPRLFGLEVDTGPCLIEAECEINDLFKTMKKFRAAPVGSVVPFSFRPLKQARFSLITEEQWRDFGAPPLGLLQRRTD